MPLEVMRFFEQATGTAAQRRTGSGECSDLPVAASMNMTGSAISARRWAASRRPDAGTHGSRPRPSSTSSRWTTDSSRTMRNASTQVVIGPAAGRGTGDVGPRWRSAPTAHVANLTEC